MKYAYYSPSDNQMNVIGYRVSKDLIEVNNPLTGGWGPSCWDRANLKQFEASFNRRKLTLAEAKKLGLLSSEEATIKHETKSKPNRPKG